jgi:hypothetical protein
MSDGLLKRSSRSPKGLCAWAEFADRGARQGLRNSSKSPARNAPRGWASVPARSFARDPTFARPSKALRNCVPNPVAESLSTNHPPRPDGPAAYNIEKRFSGTCRSLGALSSPLRRRSFSRPMPSLGESTRRESAGFRLHFRRRDYQTCPASEDALRAEDADANGQSRRASGPFEPTNRTATVVGQEKLSCISDNGRFRHRR